MIIPLKLHFLQNIYYFYMIFELKKEKFIIIFIFMLKVIISFYNQNLFIFIPNHCYYNQFNFLVNIQLLLIPHFQYSFIVYIIYNLKSNYSFMYFNHKNLIKLIIINYLKFREY